MRYRAMGISPSPGMVGIAMVYRSPRKRNSTIEAHCLIRETDNLVRGVISVGTRVLTSAEEVLGK